MKYVVVGLGIIVVGQQAFSIALDPFDTKRDLAPTAALTVYTTATDTGQQSIIDPTLDVVRYPVVSARKPSLTARSTGPGDTGDT